jgi:hypothetical protein
MSGNETSHKIQTIKFSRDLSSRRGDGANLFGVLTASTISIVAF